MSPTLRFVPAMYAAALSGRKTQTRRVITPQPTGLIDTWHLHERNKDTVSFFASDTTCLAVCPVTYGPPGTTLPIVTTWAVCKAMEYHTPTEFPDQFLKVADQYLWFNDGTEKPDWAGKSRPAMFFPKSLYHLARQARVTAVKAERVQSISEEDAVAEGVRMDVPQEWWSIFTDHSAERPGGSYSRGGDEPIVGSIDELGNKILAYRRDRYQSTVTAVMWYRNVWDSINAQRGKGDNKGCYAWNNNPWVFATTFEVFPLSQP